MENTFDKEIDWKQAKTMTGKVVIQKCMEEIQDGLFSGNKGIIAVEIPGTVKKIGEHAFSNCENLEEVLLEEGISPIHSRIIKWIPMAYYTNIDVYCQQKKGARKLPYNLSTP